MWFLIKGTVWFSMALVVLSYLGTPEQQGSSAIPAIEIGSTIAAATGAYDYLSGLCTEKPDVCVKGAETFAALGQRAKAGALVAYQILDEHLADPALQAGKAADTVAATPTEDVISDLITTGTVARTETVPIPRPRPTL